MDKVIFNIPTDDCFKELAIAIFNHQYNNNGVYREFCDLLSTNVKKVARIEDIPFLPIQFFKTRKILCNGHRAETIFTSSGTTGQQTSKHYVAKLSLYEQSFVQGFAHFYGNIRDYTILALLPSYLERSGSSLVYMVDKLIAMSGRPDSGFYLDNITELKNKLTELDNSGEKILLIGVSFALLDLAENHSFNLKNTIVMETGGMKGRRKELIRAELHEKLQKGFGVDAIHSEYGMTELLSQAYSKGNGRFSCPPWMKILIRDPQDPLQVLKNNKTGGINVIDLANIHSCSFIATQDLGKTHPNNTFEVLGRFDHSDVRGCSLMV